MTKTEKLIFIADYIKLEEQYQELIIYEIWHTIKVDLDKTIYEISKRTVLF